MSALDSRLRGWLVWLLPFVALALLLGWETDWGRAFHRVPAPEAASAPAPVSVALLPEYSIPGGADALKGTVDRTLFNPTRRPAPAAAAEAAKTQMRKGQFLLTGTTVVGDKAIAFLKESSGGKSRSVKKGESINGMTVAEVKADRVKLTLGDESEDLVLKVAAGPKTTTQPAVPPPGGAAAAPAPAPAAAPAAPAAMPAGGARTAQPGGVPPQPQSLAERRRAARAAEAAAAQGAAAPADGSAAAAPVVPPGQSSTWNSMQQRYLQRQPSTTGSK